MILLIDNYDSFVFNLRRYLLQLGQQVDVVRNDDRRLLENLAENYLAVVLSPGPQTPKEAGYCVELIRRWSGVLPMLGVCLGHQSIVEAFGGQIIRANSPMHGRSSSIQFESSRLFAGLSQHVRFARYHSLVASRDAMPEWLRVTATTEDGTIMAVEHQEHLTFGVQFHPESILSLDGHQLVRNFLLSAGLPGIRDLPPLDLAKTEEVECSRVKEPGDYPPVPLPRQPVGH